MGMSFHPDATSARTFPRTIQTHSTSNNDDRVHVWSWKQRIADLYKDKVNYFLRNQLICRQITSTEEVRRLKEVKAIFRKEDWDDVSINRASMGYCGWITCPEGPPTTRTLAILRLIVTSDLDRDVIDSFHSVKCFDEFNSIRSILTEVPMHLRSIPESLRQEYDLHFFGQTELEDEDKWERLRQHIENGKTTLVESIKVGGDSLVSSTDKNHPAINNNGAAGLTKVSNQSADVNPVQVVASEADAQSPPPSGHVNAGGRTVVVENNRRQSSSSSLWPNLLKGRTGSLGEKEWMFFRPQNEILAEFGSRMHGERDRGPQNDSELHKSPDVIDSGLLLFDYLTGQQGREVAAAAGHNDLSTSTLSSSFSSSGSGGLVSSLRQSSSMGKSKKSVRWAEQLEHSFEDEIVTSADEDGDSLQYFSSASDLYGLPSGSSSEEEEEIERDDSDYVYYH